MKPSARAIDIALNQARFRALRHLSNPLDITVQRILTPVGGAHCALLLEGDDEKLHTLAARFAITSLETRNWHAVPVTDEDGNRDTAVQCTSEAVHTYNGVLVLIRLTTVQEWDEDRHRDEDVKGADDVWAWTGMVDEPREDVA